MKTKNKVISIGLIAVAIVAAILIIIFGLKEFGIIGNKESKTIMSEFNKYYNSKDRTVIYYASTDCGYCAIQTPILETIAEDYDMDYYYVDSSKLTASQRKEVLKKLEIKHATPTTVVVEKGKVIDTKIGYTAGTEYVEFLIGAGMLPDDAVYSKEKNITFIDYPEYEKLIKNTGTNVVVVGQTTCSHCIAIKPALNSVAGEYDLTINYLNLTDMSEDEYYSFEESLKKIDYNDEDFVKEGKFGTPLTLIIKNGKVKGYISGERTTSQLVREFKKLGLIKE